MKIRIALAIVLELAYMVFTRTWLRNHTLPGVDRELWVTAYWFLFRSILLEKVRAPSNLPKWGLLLGLAPMFAVPLLFNGGLPNDPGTRAVYALTSIVVAAREELLYRGVFLNLMARRFDPGPALFYTGIVFVLYHYKAQPFTLPAIVEIFCWSYVLGMIYLQYRSLLLIIVIHALYDAAWSLSPLYVLDVWWRIPFMLSGLAITAMVLAFRNDGSILGVKENPLRTGSG